MKSLVSFKTYLDKDAVYNFINNMIEESKYCSDIMKIHFNKELMMTEEDKGKFKNSTKCCIVIMMILIMILK